MPKCKDLAWREEEGTGAGHEEEGTGAWREKDAKETV